MIASGWRTAPPQTYDFEVVLATNSACQLSLEAPRVPDFSGSARSAPIAGALAAQYFVPAIEFFSRASAPPILSAPR
jgi:hypothetical protein